MDDKFEHDMNYLKGTFAIEDMTIPDRVIANLKKAYDGEVTFDELLADAIKRHSQKG